ncbi:hypothetical protein MVES1_002687 [Malassezia vespertilionis]|uniref:Peroxisomal membrane protein PEX16 n=1 Tax=Malassezia vespertilionis TaxID=2020962 RepID=A0A2N1JAM6_9BASI|nr:uncharacterized protein MVES1_002687 [Malassezia vespertilionis]PKI83606.1 Pex16p [Malassezia vespertilionis]WFD07324.1 hypothetical protein MVES1_002687 [Malassezia vespertilionis]
MGRQWNAYEAFLLANASQIAAFESSLRNLTYLLPGRFKDSELAAEAIYAGIHLLGMYHDSILFKIVYSRRNKQTDAVLRLARDELLGADPPKLSLHAKYTNYFATHSRTYSAAAFFVMIIECTQLLIEMVARRRLPEERAWNVVIALESVKALLRLSMIRASQNRPTMSSPLPHRELDPTQLERNANESKTMALTWRGERTGTVHRALSTLVASPGARAVKNVEPDTYEYLLSHTLTEQDVSPPPLLVRHLQANLGKLAEAMWVLRPLLYVLALRRWGKRAMTPFALSLCVEFAARWLRQRSFYVGVKDTDATFVPPMSSVSLMLSMLGIENSFLDWLAGSLSRTDPRNALAKPISPVEADEWSARDRSFWWYLLRGPVWYNYTRPKIEGVVKRTENRWIIGILGGVARDYLPLVDQYYYYTSN